MKHQHSLHHLVGFLVENSSHQRALKQSVAWGLFLGTLPSLTVRKSSVAAQGQACGVNPRGPPSDPQRNPSAISKAPKLPAKATHIWIFALMPYSLYNSNLYVVKKYFESLVGSLPQGEERGKKSLWVLSWQF